MSKESLPPPGGAFAKPSNSARRMFLWTLCFISVISIAYSRKSLGVSHPHTVPIFAKKVLLQCEALYSLPGPVPGFSDRETSDRFVHGTKPTLIENATIWTGGDSGHEVILGGSVLLDRGIVKYVGEKVPDTMLSLYGDHIIRINARRAWVSPALVDMHSHAGIESIPTLQGSTDGNSILGITQPWLRSIDGLDTHDEAYRLTRSGGVGTSLILPGSADAIGGQAFMIKLRETSERSPLSMVLEPPHQLLNGSVEDPSVPPRWRHIKHAAGENPSRVYSGTRMDTIWKFREAYNEARKIQIEQDAYCEKARAGQWNGLSTSVPESLKWEALVDVLRGRVKVNVHIYETVDFTSIVGLSNEFKFPIAAFHHAHEAYLVPDVIKQTYGGVPGVAIFSTFARYKREAYRGSEFAAKILHDNGIRVAMKSDTPFPVNSRYLLHEAAQAHYYGLDSAAALASVTSTPAELTGFGHRLGYLKPSYDADVVLWDSHPLSLGATPQQVWIDGIPQIGHAFVSKKPEALQSAPRPPSFDKEAKNAVKYDGLPPLSPFGFTSGHVIFTNVGKFWKKSSSGDIVSGFVDNSEQHGTVVIDSGNVVCSGHSAISCMEYRVNGREHVVDLAGGSISPGLVSYGSPLGLVEIQYEPSTSDGAVFDDFSHSTSLLDGVEVKALDGLMFGGRDELLAYRAGVTSAITAPQTGGSFFRGLSTAFSVAARHKLEKHAILQNVAALHVALGHSDNGLPSISTQLAVLRKALLGGLGGERGSWFTAAANGSIPLAIDVARADHIASILLLKKEINDATGGALRVVLIGAAEAHLLAKEIAATNGEVSVILAPSRQVPLTWDQSRVLPGPPLTQRGPIAELLRYGVLLGVGVIGDLGGWAARNARFDIGWAMLDSNGTISGLEALALASTRIEKIFGIKNASQDLVAYHGGDFSDYEAKVVGVISPVKGRVDLF